MSWNEFDGVTTEQLKKILADVEAEADELEQDCRERAEEAYKMGDSPWPSDPADYIAYLHERAHFIRKEIKQRENDISQA